MGRKKIKWSELDLSEKLGYYWVGLFAVLVFATAVAIYIPIIDEWIEEAEYTMSEEYEDDYDDEDDYSYYDNEDEDDEDYDDESEDDEESDD